MKKRTFKPGFEFIFSLGLMVILGLPPLVSAQDKKQTDLQISINNGDTTINGKNIKELSASERVDALKSINQILSINIDDANSGQNLVIAMRKHKGHTGNNEIVIDKKGPGGDIEEPVIADNDVIPCTNDHLMRIVLKLNNYPSYTFNYNASTGPKYSLFFHPVIIPY